MRFTTTWRVLHGRRLIREVSTYDWQTLDTELLARESGMTGRRVSRPAGDAVPEIAVLSERTRPSAVSRLI
jgi:hypothetical protein